MDAYFPPSDEELGPYTFRLVRDLTPAQLGRFFSWGPPKRHEPLSILRGFDVREGKTMHLYYEMAVDFGPEAELIEDDFRLDERLYFYDTDPAVLMPRQPKQKDFYGLPLFGQEDGNNDGQ